MKRRSVSGLEHCVLHFRGSSGEAHRFSATVTGEREVMVEGRAVALRPLGELDGTTFHAADFEVAAGDAARTVEYAIDGETSRFHVAGRGDSTRIAYTSCNGSEDEDRARAHPGGRNAMWADLLERHDENPFVLLVMGGDQIYADAVWEEPAFAKWRAMGKARHEAPFTSAMQAEAEAFFLRRYAEVWNELEVSAAMRTIPAVMMWDDHDISDGWGSYPDHERESPVAQGLFAVARRAFAFFQLGIDPDAPRPKDGFASATGRHFGWIGDYGPARLVVPDLRSERTLTWVMDEGHALLAEGLGTGKHKLVISSVPLVNVDLSRVERLFRLIGYEKYVDDLRDQWMSFAHRKEWHRVIERLLDAAGEWPVSVVSGEIHLAARGEARRNGRSIAQFTASGIAHPPPPQAFGSLLATFVRKPWRRGDVELEMRRLGETGRRYLAVRNWLELDVPAGAATQPLVAILHAEGIGRIDVS